MKTPARCVAHRGFVSVYSHSPVLLTCPWVGVVFISQSPLEK